MRIKTKLDSGGRKRTVYYAGIVNGRVQTGGRGTAATFEAAEAAKVLAQLRQIDRRFAEAELEGDA